eukprot:CAMPEP_0115040288 /NCGR_PEP_ID=MMETSP0216-20121206/44698_1 /TAXON_ID=223996 /ORGANISM="Protocruzia adherens, Strain Boccale" /LENGTH=1397 /DNA_ID=CAMNT_0002421417 /DNA_START=274 /DNA_END=4467 /DNA_ORIENTATION=-
MIKSKIFNLIHQYIGEYLYGFNEDNLKVAYLSGAVNLVNVNLKPMKTNELLEFMSIPFSLKAGLIGKCQIKYNLLQWQSNPIEVEVDDMLLVLGPSTSDIKTIEDYDPPDLDQVVGFYRDDEDDLSGNREGSSTDYKRGEDGEDNPGTEVEDFEGMGDQNGMSTRNYLEIIKERKRQDCDIDDADEESAASVMRDDSTPRNGRGPTKPNANSKDLGVNTNVKPSELSMYERDLIAHEKQNKMYEMQKKMREKKASKKQEEKKKKREESKKQALKGFKNLKLTIRKVHIRYEDDVLAETTPFSFGICLEEIHIGTSEFEWAFNCIESMKYRDVKPIDKSNLILKTMHMKNVHIYWDSMSEMYVPRSLYEATIESPLGIFEAFPVEDIKELLLKDIIKAGEKSETHSSLLLPMDISSNLVILDDENSKANSVNAQRSHVKMDILLTPCQVLIEKSMVADMMNFMEFLENFALWPYLEEYKPEFRPVTLPYTKNSTEDERRARRLLVRDWFYLAVWKFRLKKAIRGKYTLEQLTEKKIEQRNSRQTTLRPATSSLRFPRGRDSDTISIDPISEVETEETKQDTQPKTKSIKRANSISQETYLENERKLYSISQFQKKRKKRMIKKKREKHAQVKHIPKVQNPLENFKFEFSIRNHGVIVALCASPRSFELKQKRLQIMVENISFGVIHKIDYSDLEFSIYGIEILDLLLQPKMLEENLPTHERNKTEVSNFTPNLPSGGEMNSSRSAKIQTRAKPKMRDSSRQASSASNKSYTPLSIKRMESPKKKQTDEFTAEPNVQKKANPPSSKTSGFFSKIFSLSMLGGGGNSNSNTQANANTDSNPAKRQAIKTSSASVISPKKKNAENGRAVSNTRTNTIAGLSHDSYEVDPKAYLRENRKKNVASINTDIYKYQKKEEEEKIVDIFSLGKKRSDSNRTVAPVIKKHSPARHSKTIQDLHTQGSRTRRDTPKSSRKTHRTTVYGSDLPSSPKLRNHFLAIPQGNGANGGGGSPAEDSFQRSNALRLSEKVSLKRRWEREEGEVPGSPLRNRVFKSFDVDDSQTIMSRCLLMINPPVSYQQYIPVFQKSPSGSETRRKYLSSISIRLRIRSKEKVEQVQNQPSINDIDAGYHYDFQINTSDVNLNYAHEILDHIYETLGEYQTIPQLRDRTLQKVAAQATSRKISKYFPYYSLQRLIKKKLKKQKTQRRHSRYDTKVAAAALRKEIGYDPSNLDLSGRSGEKSLRERSLHDSRHRSTNQSHFSEDESDPLHQSDLDSLELEIEPITNLDPLLRDSVGFNDDEKIKESSMQHSMRYVDHAIRDLNYRLDLHLGRVVLNLVDFGENERDFKEVANFNFPEGEIAMEKLGDRNRVSFFNLFQFNTSDTFEAIYMFLKSGSTISKLYRS